MTEAEYKRFSEELSQVSYNGWEFEAVYPEYLAFYHHAADVRVYCTPDFNRDGYIDIQVQDDEGKIHDSASVPFPLRTSGRIFDAVIPFLDKYQP